MEAPNYISFGGSFCVTLCLVVILPEILFCFRSPLKWPSLLPVVPPKSGTPRNGFLRTWRTWRFIMKVWWKDDLCKVYSQSSLSLYFVEEPCEKVEGLGAILVSVQLWGVGECTLETFKKLTPTSRDPLLSVCSLCNFKRPRSQTLS